MWVYIALGSYVAGFLDELLVYTALSSFYGVGIIVPSLMLFIQFTLSEKL